MFNWKEPEKMGGNTALHFLQNKTKKTNLIQTSLKTISYQGENRPIGETVTCPETGPSIGQYSNNVLIFPYSSQSPQDKDSQQDCRTVFTMLLINGRTEGSHMTWDLRNQPMGTKRNMAGETGGQMGHKNIQFGSEFYTL